MRIFLTILGFNTPEMIRGTCENITAMTTSVEHRSLIKTIYDCGYPIGDREQNRKEIKQIGVDHGFLVTEIENKGVMENHNHVIHDFCHMQVGDYYICHDPDVRIRNYGFISAYIDALESDPDVVFVCPNRSYRDEKWCVDQHRREQFTLPSGLLVAKYGELVAWSTGCFKGEWLASRPRDFKAAAPYYSWSEHADYARMQEHGKKWLEICDYYDDHKCAEQIYIDWKLESAQGKTDISFEDWLSDRLK